METINGYKNRSLDCLAGQWCKAAIASLIFLIVFGALTRFFDYVVYDGASILLMLLLLPLSWGFSVLWLAVGRGADVDFGKMFEGFKDYSRIFITMLLVGIYTFLWSLLLVVPGIVKSYSYKMTPYILADNPDLKYDAAIERSMALMKGHKMRLFLLDLSFIGWVILCLLTAGIGFIFLAPYVETAHANFYDDLLEENAGK